MALPKEGDIIQIHSYKHNGCIHRVWEETTVLKGSQNCIIGGNDRTTVTEADGRTWITREPAICYFHARHWFNVIGMIQVTAFIIIATSVLLLFGIMRH